MKNYTTEIDAGTLRSLCIENDWFTEGTNEQYKKLFDLNSDGATTATLAAVIWSFSDGADLWDIQRQLDEAKAWPICVQCVVDTLRRAEFGDTELEIIREALTTHQDAGKAYRTT